METSIDLCLGIGQRHSVTAPAVTEISDDARLVVAAREGDRAAFNSH